ncbi:MAG: hypothetical protein H7Y13_09110 [Sphingobacteriaceae bacterium]|nr:hypothetical protein [Sphingobacteriaceae bacterium]
MKRNTNRFFSTVAATVALFFTLNAQAQTEPAGDSKDTRLGIGFSAGIPTNDAYNIALGGDLRLQKDFSSNVSGLLSAGYTNFSIKDDLGGGSYGFIPVKVGVKIFPVQRFYFSGELGAAFGTDKGQETAFLYAPGIGMGFNKGIDLGLRYEGLSVNNTNLGQVALRIAYGFNLSR